MIVGRNALMLATAGALLLAPPMDARPSRPATRVEGPFGRGAASVWILRPQGRVRRVVVFAHGWKVFPPSRERPWVGQFRPWLEHLVARGSAVVFPRYQLGTGDDQGAERAADFRQGVATGLVHLGAPRAPLVAVGYSYGASLAFTFAADARRWRLPQPRAVDLVFPAGPVAGVPLASLPFAVRVLIEVGDRDTEAGRAGADAFWGLLGSHPAARKRYVVVTSHGSFLADHAAPKRIEAAARAAFWTPLDQLVDAVR